MTLWYQFLCCSISTRAKVHCLGHSVVTLENWEYLPTTLANKQWIHRSEENLCSENSSQWNWEIHCIYKYCRNRFFSRKTLAKPFISVVFFGIFECFLTIIWTWLSDQAIDHLIFEKEFFGKEFFIKWFFENEVFSYK